MKTIITILLLVVMSLSANLTGTWDLAEKDATSFITFGNGVIVLNKSIYNYSVSKDTVLVDNNPLFVFVGTDNYLVVRFLADTTNYEFLFKR